MKYLVPLAREKRDRCLHLADVMRRIGLTTRQIGSLYQYVIGVDATRELVLSDPLLVYGKEFLK